MFSTVKSSGRNTNCTSPRPSPTGLGRYSSSSALTTCNTRNLQQHPVRKAQPVTHDHFLAIQSPCSRELRRNRAHSLGKSSRKSKSSSSVWATTTEGPRCVIMMATPEAFEVSLWRIPILNKVRKGRLRYVCVSRVRKPIPASLFANTELHGCIAAWERVLVKGAALRDVQKSSLGSFVCTCAGQAEAPGYATRAGESLSDYTGGHAQAGTQHDGCACRIRQERTARVDGDKQGKKQGIWNAKDPSGKRSSSEVRSLILLFPSPENIALTFGRF